MTFAQSTPHIVFVTKCDDSSGPWGEFLFAPRRFDAETVNGFGPDVSHLEMRHTKNESAGNAATACHVFAVMEMSRWTRVSLNASSYLRPYNSRTLFFVVR